MIKFFKDAISEIHNVTWPTKKHTKHISTVAIIFTISCAIFIGFIDFGFDKAVKSTAKPVQQIEVSDVQATTENGENADVKVVTEDAE